MESPREPRLLRRRMTPGTSMCSLIGTDGSLYHIFDDDTVGWSGFDNMGGGLTGSPAAISMAYGHIDLFGRGSDGTLWHKYYQGT